MYVESGGVGDHVLLGLELFVQGFPGIQSSRWTSCPNLEGLAFGTIAESLWLVSGSHRFSVFLKCFIFSPLWDFIKSPVVLCTVSSRYIVAE